MSYMDTVILREHHNAFTGAACTLLLLSTVIEALRVIGGNVTVEQGGTVILPCKLIDTTASLTQISWQKQPQNENFFTILAITGPRFVNGEDDRFKYVGNFSDYNGALQLSNVGLMDEATYTCIFTLFPSGNVKTEIPLNLFVPPVTSLKDDHPTLGDEEVSLVTCMAAGSKPPAEVRWTTGTLEEKVRVTTNSTLHANGTTTTVSSLFGVPTRDIDQHSVQCVVTFREMSETLPFSIQVYFSPIEMNITKQSEGSFECGTHANPKADITWSRSGQSWPQSGVKVEGAKLQFLSMTSDLDGFYHCEASNLHGTNRAYIYMYVPSGACTACWTLFWLLLLLIAFLVAAVWYSYKSGKFLRTGEDTRGERAKVPTPEETGGIEELLNRGQVEESF